MIELYELQFLLDCDARELVGRMFLIDRLKINR